MTFVAGFVAAGGLAPLTSGSVAVSHRCDVVQLDHAAWKRAAQTLNDHSYTQRPEYAEASAQRVGATNESVSIVRDADIIGLAQVRIKRVPLVGGIAYISGGPITGRKVSGTGSVLDECLMALVEEYVARRGLVLRVLGPIGAPPWNAAFIEALAATGFRPTDASRSYQTMLLDLDRPPSDIQAAFSRRWRRGLIRAQRAGLELVTGSTEHFVQALADIYAPMVARKGFHVDLDMGFYAPIMRRLSNDEKMPITLVKHQGRTIAGMLYDATGDTCVPIVLATTLEGLELRASFLLHWHVAMTARDQGCRWLDLGGIDREANPGGAEFKGGMGGIDVIAAGPAQFVPLRLRARAVIAAERTYRAVAARRSRRGRAKSVTMQADSDE